MKKIFYIMGKSASGKDSVYKKLIEILSEFRTFTLYTTRPIRQGEVEAKAYHFVDEADFQKMAEAGRIIESRAYDTRHGIWRYFTVEDGQIDLAKSHYLAIGTLASYGAMQNYYGTKQLIPIYVEVEDGLRLERALKRERLQAEPKYEEMCRRFLADSADFSEKKLSESHIKKRFQNQALSECIAEILKYIKAITSL
ncbi:MAG: guanylate kinase [Lachnospiraceae bacterium]|nr:guanylate kinase [Lachnospiraceae bacterium]